ncbi:solute carrier family 12 member 3-like [Pomacea canaliculata]|uniref:solute carrier family 12 member 3-like n=1 Tax=Pomacea canaliculata TaxID=400727 RepID=UPI000D7296D8|nr:solute carrier family 12 member 3-like [Pomacea canaliculata]XP_025078246.1 solute carrier family 12 member 3-like [Pomacea canaliculata]XP_025078247.1 solute carrier family 12 member 3-like [Pomacea canaliculata]
MTSEAGKTREAAEKDIGNTEVKTDFASKVTGESLYENTSAKDANEFSESYRDYANVSYPCQTNKTHDLDVAGLLDGLEQLEDKASSGCSPGSKNCNRDGSDMNDDMVVSVEGLLLPDEVSVPTCGRNNGCFHHEDEAPNDGGGCERSSPDVHGSPPIQIFVISSDEQVKSCLSAPPLERSSGDDSMRETETRSEEPTSGYVTPRLGQQPDDVSSVYGMRSCLSRLSLLTNSSVYSDITFWDPLESQPHEDHYQLPVDGLDRLKTRRPTMHELREELDYRLSFSGVSNLDTITVEDGKTAEEEKKDEPKGQKFGWIVGVLIRCLLNIFGVMLFLRMTWITGQAGIGLASVIILSSSLVTVVSAMSMSAICTNGEVHGGGAYYLTSRSLGPEFGGALGAIFTLANAVAVAMHIVGFAETLRDLINDNGLPITGDPLNDVRLIGCGTIVMLLCVVMVGLDFESKAQILLLVLLIVSLLNYFIGTFIPPSEEKRREGFVGYQGSIFQENFGPDFRAANDIDYDFFKVFAIFFPSATGILAGANISGDLKNPSIAIPRGTFLAILLTTIVYLAIVWTCGGCMLRDAVGIGVVATNVTLGLDEIRNCGNETCKYGLQNSHAIMGLASGFPPLIYAGIFSATLSSGLACLVSAPKVLQALAKDKIFPLIGLFAKGYGKNEEPRLGYILTFVIAVGVTCIGSLDLIAPIISNFFLMSYALINFACFDAAFVKSPGFRPSFRFFNKWVSLLGALLCLVIMFFLKWWAALATVIVVGALYFYIRHRKPDVNWGSSRQARVYNDALKATLKLLNVGDHVKNFRPQILALTGCPRNRPALVDLAYSITKRQSLFICAQVLQGTMMDHVHRLRSTTIYRWFRHRHVSAFYTSVAAPTVRQGMEVLMQSQGLGKLRPNTLMLGFKNDWQTVDQEDVHNYVGIILDAFDLGYGVAVLRLPGGLDTHKVSTCESEDPEDSVIGHLDIDTDSSDENESDDSDSSVRSNKDPPTKCSTKSEAGTRNSGSPLAVSSLKFIDRQGYVNKAYLETEDYMVSADEPSGHSAKWKPSTKKSRRSTISVLPEGFSSIDRFRNKQTGTIDVWWLFDDGGLGLLVPHILTTRKKWRNCKLRVFCAGTKKADADADYESMAALLRKFRIDYSEITVVPDIKRRPTRSSCKEFANLVKQWRLKKGESQTEYPWKISDSDLATRKEKIFMELKIREKLLEHSMAASLIVVTLPVPRKSCPAGLYMAWLDTLSRDLPPTLLLRGNQESVLTYFS